MFEMINSTQNLLTKNPEVSYTSGEYISMYKDVIIYRNITSNKICGLIDYVHTFPYYNQRVKLCLIRQMGYDLQLLWIGTIPQQFKMHREPILVEYDKIYYNIIASQTISEEFYRR